MQQRTGATATHSATARADAVATRARKRLQLLRLRQFHRGALDKTTSSGQSERSKTPHNQSRQIALMKMARCRSSNSQEAPQHARHI